MSRLKYFFIAAAVVVLAAILSLLLVLREGDRMNLLATQASASISLSTGESSSSSEKREETVSKEQSEIKSETSEKSGESSESLEEAPLQKPTEMRAVWLSFYDWQAFTTGKNEADFREAFSSICDNASGLGLNTLFVQVRAFDDAMYSSEYFPWSQYASGALGEAPGYDPLEQMVEIAHQKGFAIHAWINPYRIRSGQGKPLVEGYSAAKWQAEDNGYVLSCQNGLYYNPAVPEVQQLIVSGVKEILDRYAVDGIHFDDYFYPTPDPEFDASFYAAYQQQGGTLPQMEWRQENVNRLVQAVYTLVKEEGKGRVFGISPSGNPNYSLASLSANVVLWCSEKGYVDYICPQLYYGFENSIPFAVMADRWSQMVTAEGVELYIGLAPYKIGVLDDWAAEGQQEWMENDDILARQLQYIRQLSNCDGFALFRYASLFAPDSGVATAVEQEKAHFLEALQSASDIEKDAKSEKSSPS